MFALGTDGVNTERSPGISVMSWQNKPLTPGRIPSFFIPPKLHLSVSPRLGIRRAKDADEYRLLPPSSPGKPPSGLQSPLASPQFPTKLRFTPCSKQKRVAGDPSDSASQAAMSLQHVGKVTTPYGFCTLASSPNVSRRESLFHKLNRGAATEGCSSPMASPVPPEHRRTPKTRIGTDNAEPNPDTCDSALKSRQKGLLPLMKKPKSVLKSLTPGRRKKRET